MAIARSPKRGSGRFLRGCGAAFAVLAAAVALPSQAATFGHARLASSAGQPLVVVVPVTGLTAADLQALSAHPAPASAWTQAGLTPPVALDSLTVSVAPGVGAGTNRELRIQSPQAFTGTLADILLDVKTATGSQRYQVSLIAPGPARGPASGTTQPAPVSGQAGSALGAARTPTSVRRVPAGSIRVRRGDTMLALGHRHAVDGVSVYQLMLALQRANPQAFIHENINLVRAGASLAVPDVADMLSISDAEARRQFAAQTAAFDRLRGRQAARVPAAQAGRASAGSVSPAAGGAVAATHAAPGDRVRLSEGRSDRADARTARGHALADAESRVGQLQDNVQNLNQALQNQGEAARNVVATGASAIGDSIQKIAGAISQASHEAAAQAADRVEASSAGDPAGVSSGSAAGSGPAAAAGSAAAGAFGSTGSAPSAAGSAASMAGGVAGAGDATAPGGAAGMGGAATGSPAAGAASSAASSGAVAPLLGAPGASPVSEATAHANAEAAEQHASERTQHRVNWLQDHLLGVMTALLALIVFIIAWLLRRANAARDEADADPRVTEAMVQEKLQGIDLDLPDPPQEATTPTPTPTSGA